MLTQVSGHHNLDALVGAHGGQRREVKDLGHRDAVADPASGQGDTQTEQQ